MQSYVNSCGTIDIFKALFYCGRTTPFILDIVVLRIEKVFEKKCKKLYKKVLTYLFTYGIIYESSVSDDNEP